MLGFDAVGRFALGQIGQGGSTSLSLSAQTGAIVVSVQAAIFRYVAPSDQGAILVSGSNANLTTRMLSGSGSYSTGWLTATFRTVIANQPGAYVVVGNNAALGAGGLPAATGIYTVSGKPAILTVYLKSSAGSYAVQGYDAGSTLIRESWYPTPGQTESWVSANAQSEIWTPATIQSEGWTTIEAP